MSRALGVVATALTVLTVAAGPAVAQQDAVTDPTGDASSRGLDITRVVVDNRDDAIVTTVHVAESVRGDLVVSLDPRGGHGVRIVSEYRPVAHTTDVVLGRAFSDRGGDAGPVRCPGLRVRWSAQAPVVRLRLPSSCLAGGDYGAVRYAVLTEDPQAADSDWVGSGRASAWVPRG